MDRVTAEVWTTLGTCATTMLTLLYQGWARARERRWDSEDRARVAREHAAAIAANTEITRLAADKADAAYVEANHVNLKIEALGRAPL